MRQSFLIYCYWTGISSNKIVKNSHNMILRIFPYLIKNQYQAVFLKKYRNFQCFPADSTPQSRYI